MVFAVKSGGLFLLRGVWMLIDSAQLQKRWVKVLTHINEQLLLGFDIALIVTLTQYTF